jgi:hypothetical protein
MLGDTETLIYLLDNQVFGMCDFWGKILEISIPLI